MFVVASDEWEDIDEDMPLRIIKEIRTVYEISVVTFPAYEATSVQVANAENPNALDNVRVSLDNAKAEARALERRKQKLRILANL
jgi:phage head maturation protease